LTNSPANTNVWSGVVTLENATAFQFQPNGNSSNQWGAPETAGLAVPVVDASAWAVRLHPRHLRARHVAVHLNTSNATFSISRFPPKASAP
jgi:hypothetical protein